MAWICDLNTLNITRIEDLAELIEDLVIKSLFHLNSTSKIHQVNKHHSIVDFGFQEYADILSALTMVICPAQANFMHKQ